MIAIPVFKRSYEVCVVDPDGVYLLSDRSPILLKGRVFCQIAPLLDGQRSAGAIVDALAATVVPLQARLALAFLERQGHIVEATPGLEPSRLAHLGGAGVGARQGDAPRAGE